MKIGILTFHRAHNYGAMLQAYALRKVLVNKGHEVEFISYRQRHIEDAYKAWVWKYDSSISIANNFKNFLSNIITLFRRMRRIQAFRNFSSLYLPESNPFSREQLFSQGVNYECVVFGSDQIWTKRFLGAFDDVFWGDVLLKPGKKIAYAPSMELKEISAQEKEYIQKHIRNFSSVSARETHMSKILQPIIGVHVPTVLDPTLLCNEGDYKELINESQYVPIEPYVLVYQVGRHKVVHEIANKVAAYLGCAIVEIGSTVLLHSESSYKDDLGPADFVALVKHAKFVVSCSFHGTAFSVNFHKPFYSILINGIDSRVTSFLEQVGLQKCGIRNVDDIDMDAILGIDFSKVDKALTELRSNSLSYIDRAIR